MYCFSSIGNMNAFVASHALLARAQQGAYGHRREQGHGSNQVGLLRLLTEQKLYIRATKMLRVVRHVSLQGYLAHKKLVSKAPW